MTLSQIKQRTVSIDITLWKPDIALLRKTTHFSSLFALSESGLSIRVEDFVANGMFVEQKTRIPKYADARALRKLVKTRLPQLTEYFDFEHDTIRSKFTDQNESDKSQTEIVGVAAGISVMNATLDTTSADWIKIPISNSKDLDFDHVSDGKTIFSIEVRGRLDAKAVAQAIKEIHDKKLKHRTVSTDIHPLYGIVTVPAASPTDKAVSYICDPPVKAIDYDPRKYRLLSRLMYYAGVISCVSNTFLLQSLLQRIEDLTRVESYLALDKAPLLNRQGQPWDLPLGLSSSLGRNSGRQIVGDFVVSQKRDSFLFIGLDSEIVRQLIKQDFSNIVAFSSTQLFNIREERIKAFIRTREREKVSPVQPDMLTIANRVATSLVGTFASAKSGLVFGEFSLI